MKPARIAVLAIALVAAAGSALLARGLISSPPAPEVVERAITVDTVDVLVASSDIEIGQVVKSGDISWQPWPSKAARGGFIRRDAVPDALDNYSGAIARVGLLSGEPVNDIKLVRSDTAGFLSAILPKGMRAISTKISPETGAGGFILPNDRVDVIMTRREQVTELGRRERHISETVLTNVRVLAIDQAVAEKDGQKVVVGKTATLELGPAQAETLSLAQSMGEIALALRSLRDASPDDDTPDAERSLNASASESVSLVRYGLRNQVVPGR
jgi:pilus assembly protein CpaB